MEAGNFLEVKGRIEFRQMPVGTDQLRLVLVLRTAQGCVDNDQKCLELWIGFDAFRKREAVHLWHFDVSDDNLDIVGDWLVSYPGEGIIQYPEGRLVVYAVDDMKPHLFEMLFEYSSGNPGSVGDKDITLSFFFEIFSISSSSISFFYAIAPISDITFSKSSMRGRASAESSSLVTPVIL
jgi:hypothetical protein